MFAVDCRSTRMRIAESCSWREAICLVSVMMTERYITCRAALAAQSLDGVKTTEPTKFREAKLASTSTTFLLTKVNTRPGGVLRDSFAN